jgi:protein-S-isoprenylcysteine O-methyltransferase Ste14
MRAEEDGMWPYTISGLIWVGFILYWARSSVPGRRFFEIYAGCGIGICLTLLTFGLSGWYEYREDTVLVQILQVVGGILYLAAILFVILSLAALRRRGQSEGFVERTTILINQGIFGVIRHPLYLGVALWSVALMLQLQSIPGTVLGVVAFLCAWMASKKEDAFNIRKFGDAYREYMNKVPMWNVVSGLRRKL